MHVFITSLGWIGALVCVAAYGLVSRGTWSASSTRYQVANTIGALLLCVVAARSQVWPSVASNVAWALIGAHALTAVVRGRRSPAADTQAPATVSTASEAPSGQAATHLPLVPTQASEPRVPAPTPHLEDLARLQPSSVTLVA